jgi:hypothetical protein
MGKKRKKPWNLLLKTPHEDARADDGDHDRYVSNFTPKMRQWPGR